MALNLAQKILKEHLVSGSLEGGKEISIRIDQTLTQDATGTMACLQFEAMDIPRVRTRLSVSYVDHNMLQAGFENADDHRYLQTMASKYGIYFSRPGNGICHQVHLERFAVPGETLLGSDSHTPTGGGLGMIAIGAGGLDVAVAMAGGPFTMTMPKIVGIKLKGQLRPWVSAKDVILEVLRRLTVKGGVGKIMEYTGEGVASLSAPERGTITNMGAELGATTSLFPSDERTREFMEAQGRGSDWKAMGPDPDCTYDETIEIDLDQLEPLIAQPHSPDNVTEVSKLGDTQVDQVCIGSCTNSSFRDLTLVAQVLKGRSVHPRVSLVVSPGSKQVLHNIAQNGGLTDIIAAGARLIESACGPCIGMGQAPSSGAVSLRTFNRNFKGRSGTQDAQVYLCSPEVAVASAISGFITDPRTLGTAPEINVPEKFVVDDSMVVAPSTDPGSVEILRGPNIKPLPQRDALPANLSGKVLLKVGDNITTDDIMPAGAKVLPLRSNIPAISEFVFINIDDQFATRAKSWGGGFVIGGANYGQGSSREHAALAPMYLGLKAVVAKSFARIHRSNLINFGILPLVFNNPDDYEGIKQGDELELAGVQPALEKNEESLVIKNITQNKQYAVRHNLSEKERQIALAGGKLNATRSSSVE